MSSSSPLPASKPDNEPTSSSSIPLAHPADSYMLARDYAAAARLNLQHFLMREIIGYTLHPSIPITPSMSICDIATGTGIWILDLSMKLPETVEFQGFDISSAQFPPASTLPPNVSFGTFDASVTVPEELIGKFDVVHVGFLVSIIRGNFSTWARNLISLLKPGGYLQWNDGNLPDLFNRAKNASFDPNVFPALAKLATSVTGGANVHLQDTMWTAQLGEELEKEGLVDVQCVTIEPPERLGRAFSENTILILEESGKTAGNRDVLGLCAVCGEDLKKGGIWTGLRPVVAVGRKPK